MSEKSFETLAVHAGEDLTQNHGSVSVPVYNASVFAFSDADEGAAIHNYQKEGYFYGRLGNPTQTALEKAVAELENGEEAYRNGFGNGGGFGGDFIKRQIRRSYRRARFDVFDDDAFFKGNR